MIKQWEKRFDEKFINCKKTYHLGWGIKSIKSSEAIKSFIYEEITNAYKQGVEDTAKKQENYLKIDTADIQTLINMLESGTEPRKIVDFIRAYIFPVVMKVKKPK